MVRRSVLALVVLVAGCHLPFFKSKRVQPRSPEVVVRFSAEAKLLGQPEGPELTRVTRTMADAVDSLGGVKNSRELATTIREQAKAMDGADEPGKVQAAQSGLKAALEAIQAAPHALVPKGDRDQSLEAARLAVAKAAERPSMETVEDAYRQVARAMVIVTGGKTEHARADELERLVLRFAVEEPDQARLTGGQAVTALAAVVSELKLTVDKPEKLAGELSDRAQKLASAAALEYAAQMKDALSLLVKAIQEKKPAAPMAGLIDGARRAVDQIRVDRPFELQRAVVQDALRALADAVAVGSYSSSSTGSLPESRR